MAHPLPWLVSVLWFLSAGSPAQSGDRHAPDPERPVEQFSIDIWSESDGFPQNMAAAIAQTPDGYLWFGTEEGLVRFDGVRFQVFGPWNTPVLATAWVTALHADEDGTLWVGTGGGGLYRFRAGRFRRYGSAEGLTHQHVLSLFRDRDGVLWIGTSGGGANRLVGDRIEVLDTRSGLSNDVVRAITQDSAGAIWLGTMEGLNRVDAAGITVYRAEDGLPDDWVTTLRAARDGGVWIGTASGGLAYVRDGRFTTYTTRDGLASNVVTSLYEDAEGTLWIGTNGGGLSRMSGGRSGSIESVARLPSNLVLSVAGDREGNVWAGLTGAGVARIRRGMFSAIGRPEGLSADIALAILEDAEGTVWIGTAGGGVNRLRNGRLRAFTTEDGLGDNIVTTLALGTDGAIWVGTSAGGVSRIRGTEVRSYGRADGLVSPKVHALVVDPDGSLWVATLGQGVQRWRPGAPGRTFTRADGLPDDIVYTLLRGRDGTLWVGTRWGLARIVGDRVEAVPIDDEGAPGNNVSALYEDDDGVLWIATKAGLARIRDGVVTRYGDAIGPLNRELHAVVEDRVGWLWLTSNHGIGRARKEDFDAVDRGERSEVRVEVFGRADGLRSVEANGGVNPSGIARSDGTLWFPTMKGVAIVDPTVPPTTRPIPTPRIERVVAPDGARDVADSLVFPPGSRTLEFHFTAPTFTAPDELRFRYRLEGFDEDWIEAGTRRIAYYTNLPPGDYRFRVAVRRGAEGAYTEDAVPLVLEANVWETPFFLFLCLLGLVFAGWGGYRYRVRVLTRRHDELMRLIAERERTERALRRSEETLQMALAAGRMGTWEWRIPTGELTVSAAMRELFGFSSTSIQEGRAQLEAVTPAEAMAQVEGLRNRLAVGNEEFELHFPIRREDGTSQHIQVRGRAFFDAAGRPERVAGVIVDVTEIITAQETLRRREEELRQAQKMEAVGRLAGGIAHDFNNLLTAIKGRTQFLLDALDPADPLREDVEEVRDAANRAASLTRQLLAFSRKQVLQPRILDLNQVIAGVERMLRRLVREDVVLETRLSSAIGHIRADPGSIEQVLVNLVVNAQDAMPEGGRIVIETRGAAPEEIPDGVAGAEGCVVLSVADTGYGMDEETLRQIFEPFFTTKPVGEGTGLGLSIVYGVVQQSGGEIRVTSEAGRGTRFDIYLPVVRGPRPRVEPPCPVDDSRRGSETILLVEDEPAVRSLARKILEREGYTVLDAASGNEALEICGSYAGTIDLLVTDVVMPEVGGREVAKRAQRMRPGLRVLLMSGYNEDEVLRRGVPESGMAFLQKPFEPAALARRVREVLDGPGPDAD